MESCQLPVQCAFLTDSMCVSYLRTLPSLSAESSQHNSKESHRPDLSINPEELTNHAIELDDPSQTLASSLHAVDLPSFFESGCGMTSPNPADQMNKDGMEASFTSPVLGEQNYFFSCEG